MQACSKGTQVDVLESILAQQWTSQLLAASEEEEDDDCCLRIPIMIIKVFEHPQEKADNSYDVGCDDGGVYSNMGDR